MNETMKVKTKRNKGDHSPILPTHKYDMQTIFSDLDYIGSVHNKGCHFPKNIKSTKI